MYIETVKALINKPSFSSLEKLVPHCFNRGKNYPIKAVGYYFTLNIQTLLFLTILIIKFE